jgi:hypothetical protein
MTRNKYGKRWARWNDKLRHVDLLIDLAEIRTLSRRMYETGKVSSKVRKKWRARERKNIYGNAKRHTFDHCEHKWMPYRSKFASDNPHSCHWQCCKCRCSTSWIWLHETPTSFRCEPYLQYTKVFEEEP